MTDTKKTVTSWPTGMGSKKLDTVLPSDPTAKVGVVSIKVHYCVKDAEGLMVEHCAETFFSPQDDELEILSKFISFQKTLVPRWIRTAIDDYDRDAVILHWKKGEKPQGTK